MRLIDADALFLHLRGNRGKETGSYSKGRNNGINIAISAIRNEQICPTVDAVPIDSDFEQVLICAERYACGRQTYMPHTVIRYISPLLPHLDDNTLHVLDMDMQDAVWIGGLGDPQIDAPEWMAFHEWVKNERKRRVENNV